MSHPSQASPDDQALWQAVQQGDPGAFQQMYQAYADMLFNYGCKLCTDRELVQDSLQELFLLLWEKRERIAIRSSLKSSLYTVFRREMIGKLKQQRKVAEESWELEVELSIEAKIVENEQQKQIRQELNRAIDGLTNRQKEILYLRYYENMSYDDISALMSLNANSMYKLLSAALKRLRTHLAYLLLAVGYASWW